MGDPFADLRPLWQADGLCLEYRRVDFFPERGENTAAATAVCGRCLVQAECLDFALENNIQHGIWGGVTESGRRRLREERAAA